MQQLFHVSPQRCDGLIKAACSGHLSLPYSSLHHVSVWLAHCDATIEMAQLPTLLKYACVCVCVHSLCTLFTRSWLLPFLFFNIASCLCSGCFCGLGLVYSNESCTMPPITFQDLPLNIYMVIFGTGIFVFILSLIFCCYFIRWVGAIATAMAIILHN